jgi:hypothetical protein
VAAFAYSDVWTIEMMIWLFIITMLLMGCGTHHQKAYRPEIIPTYPLLLPSSYGAPLIVEQFLEGWANGEYFQLHSQLEIDAQRMLVLGFTPFRSKAFVLRYDGKTVEFENFTDRTMPFPPELILSDIQKVFWHALPNQAGWSVVDDPTARVRLISFEGQLITHIQYQGGSPIDGDVTLIDRHYGYRLYIRTLNSWGG